MSSMDDLFADAVNGGQAAAEPDVVQIAADESEAESAQTAADTWLDESWPAACEFAGDLSGCLFVSLLTVPDVGRFEVPAEFTAEKTAVDLDGSAEWSLAQMREVITPALPDAQLEELWSNEQRRPRPRAGVLKSLTAERERRGGGFPQWVGSHAASLTRARVAAVAFAMDRNPPEVDMCLDDDEKLAALRAWAELSAGAVRRESLAMWDLQQLKLAGIRQLRLDPQAGAIHSGFLRTCDLRAVADAAELAAAVDLPEVELPSACDVFAAWQRADVQALATWVRERFVLERFAMLASWRV